MIDNNLNDYLKNIIAPCAPFLKSAAPAPSPNNPNPAPKYGLSDKVCIYSMIGILSFHLVFTIIS